MAKEKNYRIVGNQIYAVIVKLTEKETKEVKKYLDLGFKLVAEEPKVKTKEEKEAEAAANPYSRVNVENFLKVKGNEEYWTEYQRRYNEQAGTNRRRKNEAGEMVDLPDEPKFLKDGEPKKKGFANCIGWFKDNFTYDLAAGTYTKTKK